MSNENKIDDGGPAFGAKIQFSSNGYCANSDAKVIGGMTLRDWFAGQVLTGYATDHRLHEQFAHHAFKVADAMLKARNARNE